MKGDKKKQLIPQTTRTKAVREVEEAIRDNKISKQFVKDHLCSDPNCKTCNAFRAVIK